MKMSETIFRAMKGLLMGTLFGVFLLGIFFELLMALPIILALNRALTGCSGRSASS